MKTDWRTYRPSNGTEGMLFMEEWCANCKLQHPEYLGCDEVVGKSLRHEPKDNEYPVELQCRFIDNALETKCTKFEEVTE
jgi:hypothetical protein